MRDVHRSVKFGREAGLYLLCGFVSMAVSFLCIRIAVGFTAGMGAAAAAFLQGAAGQCGGIAAAYVLNRKIVYRSKAPVRRELPKFLLSRAISAVLDAVLRQVLTAAGLGVMVVSLACQCAVTVMNFVTGRSAVFR